MPYCRRDPSPAALPRWPGAAEERRAGAAEKGGEDAPAEQEAPVAAVPAAEETAETVAVENANASDVPAVAVAAAD